MFFIEVYCCSGYYMSVNIHNITSFCEATENDQKIFPNCKALIQLNESEDFLAVEDTYDEIIEKIKYAGCM